MHSDCFKCLVLATAICCCATVYGEENHYEMEGVHTSETDLSLKFRRNFERSTELFMHYFVPKDDQVIAYTQNGSPLHITLMDTLFISSVAVGEHNGISGDWLVQVKSSYSGGEYLYIPMADNLEDITSEVRAHLRQQHANRVSMNILFVIILCIPLLSVALYVKFVRPEDVVLPSGLRKWNIYL